MQSKQFYIRISMYLFPFCFRSWIFSYTNKQGTIGCIIINYTTNQ